MSESQNRFSDYSRLVEEDPLGHRQTILDCLAYGVNAVLPQNLMKDRLIADSGTLLRIHGRDLVFPLDSFDRLVVVGAGKASGAMAQALEQLISPDIDYSGAVIVPQNTSKHFVTSKIEVLEGTHPIPSTKSVKATLQIMKLLRTATTKSLVICLISGGGSALLALPADGITLGDKIRTTNLLLKSGASIEKINCIRKHLSAVKGGQLARAANGARILSLIISDIIGNPVESIASGPTSPDPTTFGDALTILADYDLLRKVPANVLKRLKAGSFGKITETPKPEDPIFEKVTNFLLGDNSVACLAAIQRLKTGGRFAPYYLGSSWQGEARDTATNLTGFFLSVQKNPGSFEVPCGFVWGGETTVSIRGKGKGGRNQEEALSALMELKEQEGLTIAFVGTDGVDGFDKAAGAMVDSRSYACARSKKLSPEKFLKDNDSNSFFRKLGSELLVTGPTGTNVNDIGVALVERP